MVFLLTFPAISPAATRFPGLCPLLVRAKNLADHGGWLREIFGGHPFVFSKDERMVLVKNDDGYTLSLYSVETGTCEGCIPRFAPEKFHDHTPISALAANPTRSKQFATGDYRGRIHLWRQKPWSAGEEIWESEHFLNGHEGRVLQLVFSPNGEQLFSAGNDGRLLEWDVRKGTLLREIARVPKAPSLVTPAFGKIAATDRWVTWTRPGQAEVNGLDRGGVFENFRVEVVAAPVHVAISPDNSALAVAAGSDITIVGLPDRRVSHHLRGFEGAAAGIRFHPTRPLLLAYSTHPELGLWNFRENTSVFLHQGSRALGDTNFEWVDFGREGENVIAATRGERLRIFDLKGAAQLDRTF